MRSGTSWVTVIVLISAGIAVALQIGKVPVALSAIESELGTALIYSGFVVAVFSLVTAFCASAIGLISDRLNHRNVALSGMILTALSGIAGAFVSDSLLLLGTRILEGVGFLMATTSIPTLIIRVSSEQTRKQALALWGVYVPAGSFLAMSISGIVLEVFDWRTLWVIISIVILATAVLFSVFTKTLTFQREHRADRRPIIQELLALISNPGPVTASINFCAYASLYFIVISFLPFILIENEGFNYTIAAAIGAGVIIVNVMGNTVSGFLHRRGVNSGNLIVCGAIGSLTFAALVFVPALPVEARLLSALCFGFSAGLIPSSLFALIPAIAPTARHTGAVNGLLVQGSAIGQLTGPPLVAYLVTLQGSWLPAIPSVIFLTVICAICGFHLRQFARM